MTLIIYLFIKHIAKICIYVLTFAFVSEMKVTYVVTTLAKLSLLIRVVALPWRV